MISCNFCRSVFILVSKYTYYIASPVRLILSMWFYAVAGQWRCQLHENLVFQERQTNAGFRLFFQGQSQCDWRGKLYLLSLKSCVATKWNESCYSTDKANFCCVYMWQSERIILIQEIDQTLYCFNWYMMMSPIY